MVKRVVIFGGTGSGKSTLAQQLSKITKIPHYSTDNFVYQRKGREKYTESQQEKNLIRVANKNKWIIEGVHGGEWVIPAVERAELIIILDIGRLTLYKRVIRRYFSREKKHYENLKDLWKMLYWAHIYKNDNYLRHSKFITDFKKEYLILRNKEEIRNFLINTKKFFR